MTICTNRDRGRSVIFDPGPRPRKPVVVAMWLAALMMVILPDAASAMSRLQRNLLAIPPDFLADEEPPDCARGMWSNGDRLAIAAIEQNALVNCQRLAGSANKLRRARERQIVDFRKTVIRQRERVTSDPIYPEQGEELDVVAKLLEQSACDGEFWTGYREYMSDFIVEYRILARITSIRNLRPIGQIDPVCSS